VQNDEGKGLEPNRDKQKNEAQDALTTVQASYHGALMIQDFK